MPRNSDLKRWGSEFSSSTKELIKKRYQESYSPQVGTCRKNSYKVGSRIYSRHVQASAHILWTTSGQTIKTAHSLKGLPIAFLSYFSF